MGISIENALENNIISTELVHILPRKCKCGAYTEFSDSLRELKCTNKNCKFIVINRIRKFTQRLNIGMTDSNIEELVDRLNITTPFQILLLSDAFRQNNAKVADIDIHNKEDIIQNIEKIKQSEYLLYEIVELCGIESISKIAFKIFYGFDDLDKVYEEIESGQVAFINERLGIKSQDSSIISLEIYNKLMEIKEELIFAESQFNIIKNNHKTLNIAINDNVLPFINISELIDWLNDKYNYTFNLVTTISDNTDILVKNCESTTAKFRIARLINDRHIADLMNNGELSLADIGKFTETDIKPLGSKVYIDTLDNIIQRLDKFK